MQTVNQVMLLGTLGRDSETKFTQGGQAVTSFSMATNRNWKDKQSGEWKKETDWHNVTAWGKEKLAEYLVKGSKVFVQGRLQTRSYEDKNGQKKYVTEVVADVISLLGDRQEKQDSRGNEGYDTYQGGSFSDGDTPF